jgi:hypothetical protein
LPAATPSNDAGFRQRPFLDIYQHRLASRKADSALFTGKIEIFQWLETPLSGRRDEPITGTPWLRTRAVLFPCHSERNRKDSARIIFFIVRNVLIST